MSESDYSSDFLKPVNLICNPDPRNAGFFPGFLGGGEKKVDLFHERISKYKLSDLVPVEIHIHFETAKNIYLYSWFVFRFFNVAEHQALTTLELGLKYLYKGELRKNAGLSRHLQHAAEQGHIKSEDISLYRHRVWLRAKARYEDERHRKMRQNGLSEIILNESEITIKDEDHFEYMPKLIKHLCYQRNHYSHGSKSLYENVLKTFEQVSELLNSAYRRKQESSAENE